MIVEANDAVAPSGEECGAPRIALHLFFFEVLRAIDFNDQLYRVGHEIDDVRTNWRLAPEANASKPVGTQAIPDDPLRIGHRTPQ
jgi:hypothetical protein